MVSEKIYELCRPVLENEELGEEEKTDKLEELLSSEPTLLKGKALEDAVLGTLWQWKGVPDKLSSSPARGAMLNRTRSPASWLTRTGSGTNVNSLSSPRLASTTPIAPPGLLSRTRSSTASPFSSPKPSPRLPLATPVIPHSPRLSAYQFSDSSSITDKYGDYGSDGVDWLVNDDTSSNTSFGDSGFATTTDFMSPSTIDMSPYDMLRSILQDNRSDDELEHILEANGYDLGQTINSIMEAHGAGMSTSLQQEEQKRGYLVGKDMTPASRPVTPLGQQKSPIVCRYWLSSGHCARADCRFAHEVQNHVCKYWLQGNCIAGSSCLFSHDPALLMQQLSIANGAAGTPPQFPPNFSLQDYDSFPLLQPSTSNPYDESTGLMRDQNQTIGGFQQQQQAPPGLFPTFVPTGPRYNSRPNSRPASRQASRAPTPNQPNFQDDEAFPSLGSAAAAKSGKRHHGKRGGHGNHNSPQPGSLADVVRMAPNPAPNSLEAMRRGLRNNRSFTSTRENSLQAGKIPPPTEIPWLETGPSANAAYLKARQEAFKHGGMRNRFLQSAAQAWNRNDARGAKALSLRGQNENTLMREKHREAARALYEERNSHQLHGSSKELYIDLHGLHPEEAVNYLSHCLKEQQKSPQPVYAICGTGHHSKNGKDKVGKAVRAFLNELRYVFREFSVPGDKNHVGGILGIDPGSYDRNMAGKTLAGDGDSGVGLFESLKVGEGGSGGEG